MLGTISRMIILMALATPSDHEHCTISNFAIVFFASVVFRLSSNPLLFKAYLYFFIFFFFIFYLFYFILFYFILFCILMYYRYKIATTKFIPYNLATFNSFYEWAVQYKANGGKIGHRILILFIFILYSFIKIRTSFFSSIYTLERNNSKCTEKSQ